MPELGEESRVTMANTQISFDSQTSEMSWAIKVAQACEHVWNESGRSSAKKIAMESVDLMSLRDVLREGTSLERTKALYIMSLLEPSEVIDDFNSALKFDNCPIVRHEAAYFLGTIQSNKAIDCLGEALIGDAEELVRHEAAEALGELGIESGQRWLEKAINDPSELVRRTVEIARAHIKSKRSLH